jgi:ribosomal-protein-alanine N-acetyltransferase
MNKLPFPSLSWQGLRPADSFPSALFRHPPTLETPRLVLRKARVSDAGDVFSWSSDPEVARYVLWSPHQSLSETRGQLRALRSLYRRGLPSSLIIQARSSGRAVGTIGIMAYSPENRSAEVGYSLSRDCWNQGIMTEALARVIRWMFEELYVNRIEGQFDLRNPASGRVMEKCGMRREGILRQRLFNKGEAVDVGLCAILRQDYLSPGNHF